MVTLYRRATPRQAAVLRIVEGAVRNAMDAHPDYGKMDRDRFARSVSKRAAGTLTATWPSVLARATASEDGGGSAFAPPSAGHTFHGRCRAQIAKRDGAVSEVQRHRAIRDAMEIIGKQVGRLRREGHTEVKEALIAAMRLLAAPNNKNPA